jgi:hypothetical protein
LGKEDNVDLAEIGSPGPVKQATERDIDMAAFGEQKLLIRVQHDKSEGALPTVCPEVNSVQQPIVRGKDTWVKRKYVEAMARSRVTTYEQITPNPADPSNIQLRPTTTLSNDFVVIQDPHPKGREWLQQILEQP